MIIANLDAEIEQFYADQGTIVRELQIFGRVWPLIPAMTSITLAPLMQIQAAAQMADDTTNENSAETRSALFSFLGGVNDILANVIREDERSDFKKIIDERGFPLGILPKVIEAIMQAFDAAPLVSETTSTPPPQMNTPQLASNTDYGNSQEDAGDTSIKNSMSMQKGIEQDDTVKYLRPEKSVNQHVAKVLEEQKLKAYDEATALIPPSVKDA